MKSILVISIFICSFFAFFNVIQSSLFICILKFLLCLVMCLLCGWCYLFVSSFFLIMVVSGCQSIILIFLKNQHFISLINSLLFILLIFSFILLLPSFYFPSVYFDWKLTSLIFSLFCFSETYTFPFVYFISCFLMLSIYSVSSFYFNFYCSLPASNFTALWSVNMVCMLNMFF